MSCSITISEAYGLVDSAGSLTAIVVRGTATDCTDVVLTIEVAPSEYRQITVDASTGSWTGTFLASSYPGEWPWYFECGDLFRVLAACKSDWSCLASWGDELACREAGGCPTVTWPTPTISACNEDGTRHVEVTVTLDSSSGDAIVAELRLDGSTVDSGTGSGTLALSLDTDLREGTYILTVEITSPEGCTADRMEIIVPPCGCPDLTAIAEVAKTCNDDGTRTVTLTARRAGAGDAAHLIWDKFGDESIVDGYGKLVLSVGSIYTVEWDYEPGEYEAILRILDPEGCEDIPVVVEVPECPGSSVPGDPDDPKDPGDPGEPKDPEKGSGGGCVCAILKWLIMLLTAATLLMLLLGVTSPAAVITGFALAILSALFVAMGCGVCELLRWIIYGLLIALVIAVFFGAFGVGELVIAIVKLLGSSFETLRWFWFILGWLLGGLGAVSSWILKKCDWSKLWPF